MSGEAGEGGENRHSGDEEELTAAGHWTASTWSSTAAKRSAD